MLITIIGNGRISNSIIKKTSFDDNIKYEIITRNITEITKDNNIIKIQELKENTNIDDKIIFLSIPPKSFKKVSKKLKGKAKLIISVLPEIKIKELKNSIMSLEYVRLMPNISINFDNSLSYIYSEDILSVNTKQIITKITKIKILTSENEYENSIIPFSVMPAYFSKIFKDIKDSLILSEINEEKKKEFLIDGLESFLESIKGNMNDNDIEKYISTKDGITEKILKKYIKSNINNKIKDSLK